MVEPLLSITGLKKRFGALQVTDKVDLDVRPGEIHALIGPNGAGKSTLLNQIAGEIKPDSGTIRFRGREITRLPVHERSRAGISRTFQVTTVFDGLSVMDNVSLAVQVSLGHSFSFWRRADSLPGLKASVAAFLAMAGLEKKFDVKAGNLSHGEKRQVAIAMALATEPRLILMDEPAAGMGRHESDRIAGLLTSLKKRHAMLLVEHDMDLVFCVADRISVLVYGRIIATGIPEEVRSSQVVKDAYLGEVKQ